MALISQVWVTCLPQSLHCGQGLPCSESPGLGAMSRQEPGDGGWGSNLQTT